jgi:hypothetical protein
MPHAGLMDEKILGPREGAFQRARLHIRGGKRRLRQGKIAAGIVTLYDAVLAAMDWYAASSSEGARGLVFNDGEDIRNEKVLYAVLVRSGVLDGKFDFEAFDRLTERALDEEMPGYDYRELLAGVESVMTQLGIMPFDESLLPPEDPKTF